MLFTGRPGKGPIARGLMAVLLLASLLVVAPGSAAQPKEEPVCLSREVLATGFRLLKQLPISRINLINLHFQFGRERPWVIPAGNLATIEVQLKYLTETLESAPPSQQEFLQQQLEQLKAMRDQLKGVAEYRAKLLDHHIRVFEYQKQRDEALLRKEKYDVPIDKLVVVVADFASGEPAKGREIADEVAAHLRGLREHGIDVHVLVGEIKPGVVIRSEEMALEVGKHFPPQTNYIVLWGSMSELTVGRFRPHLTCAYRQSEINGLGSS